MRAGESSSYQDVGPGDYGPIQLNGGIYQVLATGFTLGSATLYVLGPDDTTYLSMTDSFSSDGGDTIYLAPGQYKWTVVTDSGVYLRIVRVPGE